MKELFGTTIPEAYRSLKNYFKSGHDAIMRNNILMLLSTSFLGFFGTLFLLVAAHLLMASWTASIGHWVLLPFFAIFTVVGYLLHHNEVRDARLVNFALYSYLFCLMGLIIYISVVPYDTPSAIIPICTMVVLPAVFILNFWQAALVLVGMPLILLAFTCLFAAPLYFGFIAFDCLFGLVFGTIVYFNVLFLRTGEYASRAALVLYSTQDKLTGILNKSAAEKNSQNYLSLKGSEGCALIVLDIDNFKAVNDNNGHLVGDRVLTLVGRQLKDTFRDTDIVGRIGGDEFVALVKKISQKVIIERKLEDFARNVKAAALHECGFPVTCSIGGIVMQGDCADYDKLFQQADRLLYRAKRSGKDNRCILTLGEAAAQTERRSRMLIVDDEEMNCALLKSMFESEYDVEIAHDGLDALALISQDKLRFNVILLDLIMPKMDGHEVLRALQSDPALQNVPVVVVSADEQSELKMLEMGVADMITKPFDARIAQQRVRNAVLHWRPQAGEKTSL